MIATPKTTTALGLFAALRRRIEHNAQYLTADDRAALAELLLRPPAPASDAKTYGPAFSG